MKRLAQWKLLVPMALFLVLVVFLGLGLGRDPREVPSPFIDKPAPSLALPRLDDAGLMLRREDLLGQVWMLNVWASWCVACRVEHETLLALSRRKLLPIYGLNYKDTREAGQAWLLRYGNPYQASAMDAQGRAGIDWGVYGVPETFVIDAQGRVRLKHVGPLTEEVIATRIEPLLKELRPGT
jgi:cytochrome c biogenesis protein CcmG/thiol:disulfide interchange protein DsbE